MSSAVAFVSGVSELGSLPAGSVVYVPTEGGVPLMRSVNGSN